MLQTSTGRHRRRLSKSMAALTATIVLTSLLALSGGSVASAAGKSVDIGGEATFADDGGPVAGLKVDLFEALSPWDRGGFIAPALTDGNGKYSFAADPNTCYILVGIAPLGASFGGIGSGQVYDQRYACTTDESNLDVDLVLYREAPKPPPTTTPPTTTPPTTAPPTTLPPTTLPPTTLPPTTTTAPPPPVDPPYACAYQGKDGRLFINGTDARSFLLYTDATSPAFALITTDRDGFWLVEANPPEEPFNRLFFNPTPELMDPALGIFSTTFLHVSAVDADGKNASKRIKCHRRASPIALDVDGSGLVERVSAEVAFDFAGDGEAVTVGEWFAPTEGILFDASVGGPITGEHLFGDQAGLYNDGFEKLALLDTNADGQVAGAELDGLAIWTDVNTNGVLDAGEQSTLADHGVVSISTSHTNMVSSAALADGSTMMVEDLWFPEAQAAGASNTTSLVLLGLGGLSLLGYVTIVSRRRRDNLDAELQELLNQQDSVQ